mgnify:CR=1 FL=1
MKHAKVSEFWNYSNEIVDRMRVEGVICSVVNKKGEFNLITLGWGLIGYGYHGNPIFTIAITPLRYSWTFIEEVPEFVIGVPDDSLKEKAKLCGTISGRDADKFKIANLTPAQGMFVKAPLIRECPINIECKVYTKVYPPHMLLTPEHRKRPIEEQHTIYFAEVLGIHVKD